MAKDRYEISLWEDYLVEAIDNIPAHFEEKKLCTIGSDSMTSTCRAYEPKLVENINGTNTFTFKMYYVYTEEGQKEPQKNPFINLLVNERKVKVLWKDEWYDLVIKNIQEDSNGKSIIYTCKDLYVNELSKNGFNLEFADDLENNQGTVIELAKKVLKDTDWQVDELNSEVVQQKKEEPVYEVTLLHSVNATNETTGVPEVVIPQGSNILVFYSAVTEQNLYCQFLYSDKYVRDTNSQLVIDCDCYSVNLTEWRMSSLYQDAYINNQLVFSVSLDGGVSNEYRGSRLVRKPKSIFDPLTEKYVEIYKATADGTEEYQGLISKDDIIYKYTETEFRDPTYVNNFITNPKDFASSQGWLQENGDLIFQLYPPYTGAEDLSTYTAKSQLRIRQGNIYNNGLRDSLNYFPNGIQIGEKFIFRIKILTETDNGRIYVFSGVAPRICNFIDEFNYKRIDPDGNDYFTVQSSGQVGEWLEYTLTCKKSISRSEVYQNRIGIFLVSNDTYWIEEVQLYPLVYSVENDVQVRIDPGEMDKQSIAQIYYKYYNHTKNTGIADVKDLKYLYVDTIDLNATYIVAQYNDNFEKIRSITVKNSNRFNLLQTLAETFECWCKFRIEHDNTGKVIYIDGVPQKFVSFVNEVGKETGVGFVYGIDLKGIQRTIQSDQIVTKTIVSANNNEFAKNGFCTIARSTENYPRETFILNFDYYITQGLIDGAELNRDLYLTTPDSIAYYYTLNKLNIEYDNITDLLKEKKTELTKQLSYQHTYEGYLSSLGEEAQNLQTEILQLSATDSWSAATTYVKTHPDNIEVVTRMNTWQNCKNNYSVYESMLNKLNESITALQNTITQREERQKEIVNLLNEKHFQFYKKYSRFIQEGYWINEDYIDDTLYYLDAQSVAYTSSRPQISYNISVLRISSIPEFENKVFHLGDISFVQDTEFFGYIGVNGIKTPYKEKVLVSEITSNFDAPELDSFKVQNYKTQFEDLFQRITSTTQSLQYASGSYAKVVSAFEPTGIITPETLQNSINLNNELVYSSQNESIVSDSTGLTVTDSSNPNNKTKVTSGGIFISTNGGQTWKNAVRGEGVATQYLTTGSINTNSITILDGVYQTFKWDSTGINAYYDMGIDPQSGQPLGINLSKFVRFDHYGVYGIDVGDIATSYTPIDENDIWNTAKFGMTWRGFFMKNKFGNGWVEVSSEEDIRVMSNSDSERIKIGRIGGTGTEIDPYIYGIRIRNSSDQPVMESDDTGELWLKNKLNISDTEGQYNIGIGYLEGVKDSTNTHEIFNANNKFVVYEDGSMVATDGSFTGIIEATGGHIGNMTIEQVENLGYQANITSDKGTIFRNGEGVITLTARLMRNGTEVLEGSFSYRWYLDDVELPNTSKEIKVMASSADEVYVYKCEIDYIPPTGG